MSPTEILITIFSASGFWALLQLLVTNIISKKENKKKTLDEIKESVDNLTTRISQIEEQNKEQDAKTARARILRFNDELLNNIEHSKEAFDDTLAYIDEYDKYCNDHPLFSNSRTMAAEQNIRECYQNRMKKHDFIGGTVNE